MKKERKPLRVLCLDGGGILGYYTASVLENLVNTLHDTSVDIGKAFDLICGTSTGAILAAALAKGIPIEDIKALYKQNAHTIFPVPMPHSTMGLASWTLTHLNGPSASHAALEHSLDTIFSDMTIEALYTERNIGLCITSIDATTYKSKLFKTPHLTDDKSPINYAIKDICLASAAAPMLFSTATIQDPMTKDENLYADGALWANNPVLIGLTEALKMAKPNQPIEIFTLEALSFHDTSQHPNHEKGIIDWMGSGTLFKVMSTSQADGFTKLAKSLASSFCHLGQAVKVVNFTQISRSKKEIDAVGFDKVDQEAFNSMDRCATDDVTKMEALVREGDENTAKIFAVFKSMTPHPKRV